MHALVVSAARPTHQFTSGRGCAELNTDRFQVAEQVATDNWVGGFYMEVYVDGWDVVKTTCVKGSTDGSERVCASERTDPRLHQPSPVLHCICDWTTRVNVCARMRTLSCE